MKLPIEKPFEPLMRFFTPELYLRFRALDDAVADQAQADWDAATARYRKHLRQLRKRYPNAVAEISELCLHDAELLGVHWDSSSSWALRPSIVTVLTVRAQDEIISLVYAGGIEPEVVAPPDDWPPARPPILWLYDEFDAQSNQPGSIAHRILLSDGRVVVIAFVDAVVQRVPIRHPEPAASA